MTSAAPGAPPAARLTASPGGPVPAGCLLSRIATLCLVELQKLRHDRTELLHPGRSSRRCGC